MLLKAALLLVVLAYSKTSGFIMKENTSIEDCYEIVESALQTYHKICPETGKLLGCVNRINSSSDDMLRNYRFVVLAYIRMNNMTKVCELEEPRIRQLNRLRNEVLKQPWTTQMEQNKKFIRLALLKRYPASPSAEASHKECMDEFSKLLNHYSACTVYRELIQCFERKALSTQDRLTEAFYNVTVMPAFNIIFFGNQPILCPRLIRTG
ncbi:uncharacterized protein LOC116611542 [Nematostella vectensis]|uniref:uncharacterized protein LOC116611542 n=1 Tax=Nematostella vectensis TaxID=45351 RepID=UPI002076F764|nr:uncharacterized protein LOC116611542 [Nematostella vectensis]XP_032227812.2 uncharacterized protein LOC116611542 [Nematostella vectensis]